MLQQTITKEKETKIYHNINEISNYISSTYYTNKAKGELSEFNDNYKTILINYIDNHPNTNLILENYLDAIIKFTNNIDNKLNIQDYKTFEKLLQTLEISKIALKKGNQYEDLDLILDSFFRLEPSLNTHNIMK